jgi:hypothetical protein
LNPLNRTLKQVNEACVVPVIPLQQSLALQGDFVPCGNSRVRAGCQV